MNTVNLQGQQIKPSKILCIGRNYVEHIHELGNEIPEEMVVFIKPNSAITEQLQASHQNTDLHYESELCFMYQAGQFSAVALGLDLTKRSLQTQLKSKGLPWERAKAFDGSAVFSDFVPLSDDMVENLASLALSLKINDTLIQQGGVELMMYKPAEILNELSRFITLEDGDIVMTGTPKGVGKINQGDLFQGQVTHNNQVIINHSWQVTG